MEFTMPEALTKWKFMGFAHDKELRSGYLEDDGRHREGPDGRAQSAAVPPRRRRARVHRQGDQPVARRSRPARCGWRSPTRRTNSVDAALGNATPTRRSTCRPGDVEDVHLAADRARRRRADHLQGGGREREALRRRGGRDPGPVEARAGAPSRCRCRSAAPATKHVRLHEAAASPAKSDTLKHQTLTVQMVSQPAWYAVMALPYLMEYPHECSEQTFNRLYANALARHIANSDPKIRRVFDQWKNTPALDSPLEKNQDLKAVHARGDAVAAGRGQGSRGPAERRHPVRRQPAERGDGPDARRSWPRCSTPTACWPWFPGGPANDYITLYITTGFGRLRHLGVKVDTAPAIKSLDRLDAWTDRASTGTSCKHGGRTTTTCRRPSPCTCTAGASSSQDKPIATASTQAAVDYWQGQARKYWLQAGQPAVAGAPRARPEAVRRPGDAAGDHDVDQGAVGRRTRSWACSGGTRSCRCCWYHAPIETQAVMIEAFDEVANDPNAVEECKVWLLKQKQTQNWKTTKATADAVYALLLRGDNLLDVGRPGRGVARPARRSSRRRSRPAPGSTRSGSSAARSSRRWARSP